MLSQLPKWLGHAMPTLKSTFFSTAPIMLHPNQSLYGRTIKPRFSMHFFLLLVFSMFFPSVKSYSFLQTSAQYFSGECLLTVLFLSAHSEYH